MSGAITPQQKHLCALREARMRRRVYARKVTEGKMTPEEAEREIATMEAIAADYAPADLFGGTA